MKTMREIQEEHAAQGETMMEFAETYNDINIYAYTRYGRSLYYRCQRPNGRMDANRFRHLEGARGYAATFDWKPYTI